MQQFAAVVRLCEQSLHVQASQREELSTNTLALEQMQARLDAMTRALDEEQETRHRLAGLSTKQSKELSQLQQQQYKSQQFYLHLLSILLSSFLQTL